MGPLDRRSIVIQLRDELVQLISSEHLEPGAQLPSEAELAASFGVARGTVREAFKLLEQGGLIDVHHGKGRFVSAIAGLMVDRPVTEFESVTEMLTGLGYRPTSRVLSVEVARATEQEAEALELARDTEVVRLRRLRLHEGEALIFEINTFDAALLGGRAVGEVDFSGSLNEWLAAQGRAPASSAAQIRAVPLPEEAIALIEVDADTPWLLIAERCVDSLGAPVLFSQDFHRGDVFSFHVLRQRST